ncbi:hypothetical protein JXA12_02940 [Candidatus Woesearchaeota archaeon]|nr:hypothetical protein [Candidatus Woesearchaeota archaeon]
MKALLIVSIIAIGAITAGCGAQQEDLIGCWQDEQRNVSGTTITFTEQGEVIWSLLNGSTRINFATGSYTLKGRTVIMENQPPGSANGTARIRFPDEDTMIIKSDGEKTIMKRCE